MKTAAPGGAAVIVKACRAVGRSACGTPFRARPDRFPTPRGWQARQPGCGYRCLCPERSRTRPTRRRRCSRRRNRASGHSETGVFPTIFRSEAPVWSDGRPYVAPRHRLITEICCRNPGNPGFYDPSAPASAASQGAGPTHPARDRAGSAGSKRRRVREPVLPQSCHNAGLTLARCRIPGLCWGSGSH